MHLEIRYNNYYYIGLKMFYKNINHYILKEVHKQNENKFDFYNYYLIEILLVEYYEYLLM